MTNIEKDALVRAIALLTAKGDTTLAESYLPWIYLNKQPKSEGVKRFVPPTEEEVGEYCEKMHYTNVNPSKFVAFYESKGWMVGNAKMRSWQAAVKGWNQRDANPSQATVFDDPTKYW